MKFILTGTTGAGKTTIINHLREHGHAVVREAFMDVFHELRASATSDPLAAANFLDEVLRVQIERESAVDPAHDFVYFDRSPLCTLALARFMGREPSSRLRAEVDRMVTQRVYSSTVFLVQNLNYVPGNEVATLTYEQLVAFEEVHRSSYVEAGFRCIEVPPLAVEARAAFILDHSRVRQARRG